MAYRHEHHRGNHHNKNSNHGSSTQQSGSSSVDKRGDKYSSSSDKYGVWKGTPISYSGQTLEQDKSPHITLTFDDGTGKTVEANINVASTSTDTELVYWLNNTWSHPVTKTLTSLSSGFTQATTTDGTGLSLDFLRTTPALVDFSAGRVVQDSDASDTANNILDQLEPIIKAAIAAKATVYIFGRDYGTGIDDVHMNQGNTGDYQNAVGTDGALIFHYPTGNQQWVAVFLAFASQEVPTDNTTGAPAANAKALDTIAKGGSSASSS
ncbi:Uncharacterized protein LCER1_G008812 [Lachnellula cervina]|uniref:Uncharacterized protein n=1 Tax=Lachnellula cervina TaxID=1316786 RepID=A0A7D8YQH2_9HELO|nr:Uncharacterized protein LCER1_G008812 [Lachnellula cervina]